MGLHSGRAPSEVRNAGFTVWQDFLMVQTTPELCADECSLKSQNIGNTFCGIDVMKNTTQLVNPFIYIYIHIRKVRDDKIKQRHFMEIHFVENPIWLLDW